MSDPLEILNRLADSCTRAEDGAFWILTSAAAHLVGFQDDEGSTADAFFWDTAPATAPTAPPQAN